MGTPPLDGSLTTDEPSLTAVSDDFGTSCTAAMPRPGSVRDVVALVRFGRAHRLPVSASELTTEAGGTRCPVGSIPVGRADKGSWSRARASSEPTLSEAGGRGRARPVRLSRLGEMPHNA